jgi:chromo domain-containing protein 1
MDEDDFRKLVRKNRARFEWAEKNPEAADKEERAKKLQALVAERKRTRTNISDDEEEAAPICPQKRNSPQQMVPPEVTLADREAIDASQLNNLFLDSQDIPSPGAAPDGDLFVRQPLKERRPPLAQSESSVSDGEETDDSLMAELGEESHHEERKSTGSRGATGERRSTRKSAQSPKSASKRATTASTPKSTKKLNQLNTARNNESRRPLQPQAGTTPRNQEEQSLAQKSATSKPPVRTTSAAQRKASTSAEDTNSAAAVPAGASANTVKSSSGPVGQFTARRTAPGSGASGGIKFVNQPKTQQRGAWQNGDNHYKTLHFRAVADKRSRTEGAPDVSALQIVNDPSVPVQSRSQAPHDDPYARREMGNRRVREEQDTDRLPRRGSDDLYCRREMGNRRYQEQDVDNTPRRGSADEIVPLQPWETDKVPLVCSAWRLSSNCPKTAQQCRFMHRNKDPNGKDYALGDLNGLVPPKHGKPPLTCRYWLLEARGCKNSAEKCLYAHRNTGWLPHEDPAVKEPVQIDPTVLPGYVASRDKRAMRPSELTCWYWTMGQCRNSPEACAFQHYNTGIVADPPPGARLCHDWVRNRHTRCTKGIACKFLHPPASDVSGGDGHVAQRTFLPTSVGTTNADESEEAQPQFADGLLEQPPPQPPLSSFRPPPPPPIEFPPAKAECAQLQAKIEKAYSLDYDKLFARHAGHVDRKALLIYDSEQHAEELEVVTRWLLMHHIEVFSVRSEGAWDRFRQEIMAGGSGVIIVSCSRLQTLEND